MLVKGQINIDSELSKLAKGLDLNQIQLDKIHGLKSKPEEYEKMPEEVRKLTEEKLRTLQAERDAIESARKNFESIRDA